eukprot:3831967-Amphidinium_carterae.1
MLVVDDQLSSVDPAQVIHATQLKLWAQNVQRGTIPERDLWAALAYAANRLLTTASPWAVVHGPAGAILLMCVRLGMQMQSPFTVTTAQGMQLDLREFSPSFLAQEMRRATIAWTDRVVSKARWTTYGPFWWTPVVKHRVPGVGGMTSGPSAKRAAVDLPPVPMEVEEADMKTVILSLNNLLADMGTVKEQCASLPKMHKKLDETVTRVDRLEERIAHIEGHSSSASTISSSAFPPGLQHVQEECLWIAGGWANRQIAETFQKQIQIQCPFIIGAWCTEREGRAMAFIKLASLADRML